MSYWGPAEFNTGNPFTDIDKLLEYMFNCGISDGSLSPLKYCQRTEPPLRTQRSGLYLENKDITKEFLETAGRSHLYQYTFRYPAYIYIFSVQANNGNDEGTLIFNAIDKYVSERVTLFDYPNYKWRMRSDFSLLDKTDNLWRWGFVLTSTFVKQITALTTY